MWDKIEQTQGAQLDEAEKIKELKSKYIDIRLQRLKLEMEESQLLDEIYSIQFRTKPVQAITLQALHGINNVGRYIFR